MALITVGKFKRLGGVESKGVKTMGYFGAAKGDELAQLKSEIALLDAEKGKRDALAEHRLQQVRSVCLHLVRPSIRPRF